MFVSGVRSKLAMVLIAPIVATVAIIGSSPLALAAERALPAPSVVSFTATPTSLTYVGGKVVLAASLDYAGSCVVTASPAVPGLPKSFRCSDSLSTAVVVRPNRTASPINYSFGLTVKNRTGVVTATPVVVGEAATPPIPAPVVSSFTASNTSLSDDGGRIELRASIQYGATCTISVTPSLKGFPSRQPCTSKVSKSVTLSVDKTPNSVNYTFALTVENKTSSVAATNVVVSVGASPPPLSFSPRSLTFAKEGVFVADDPVIVTVHNNASTTQVVGSVAIGSVGEPTDFILNRNNCSYLTAHENCSFAIQFQPSGAGPRTGIVNIVDSSWGTAGDVGHVDLFGTGVWATATISNAQISQNTLHFPVQGVLTTSRVQYVRVINVGSVPLYISGIGVTGEESTDFSVSAGSCINQITNSYPFIVGLHQHCIFGVAFEPSSAAIRATNVVLDDNTLGTQTQLQLQGTGAYTTDTVDGVSQNSGPLNITFSNSNVGASTSKTLTIVNTGSFNLDFTGPSISGINAGEFGIDATSTCVSGGVEIAVRGSCTVQISFAPAATGVRSAILKIGDNTSGGFETVDLTGTGT